VGALGAAVEVRGLRKVFNGVVAVDNVSFEVSEGEIFGLIGPNGAGKTTTLRIIAGMVKPDLGEVRIMGSNPFREGMRVKELLGYLPEEADVYSRLTGLEHLRFYASLYGGRVDETVRYGAEISGLGGDLNKRAGEYSKGMKRRLLLSLVLMRRPRVALLDEPTSGLDVYSSLRVRDLIKRYARENKTAVILSSHNMLEVEYVCDRVAFISRGRIVAAGSPDELKEKYNAGNLEEVFVKATGG
jgi:ABC-2 type transport system ATP-binding protein